jgi:DNA-binding SARP family transcriptional activator
MPDYRILGPLEVVTEAGPLALGGQKQRALLAVLILEANRVVSVDRIVDALWGEHPPRTAVTSLQNFVSQLRKVLGPEVLETQMPGYRLRVGAGELDVDRFRELCDAARGAEVGDRRASLHAALELWRGPALAEFQFDAFAQGEIARLEELRLAAFEDRLEADLEAGLAPELVGELESLASEHPLRERLRAHLMLALYRSGRQADALAVYQDARRALVEGLGIEPSPALQELHGAMLRQEVGLQPVGTPAPAEDHFNDVLATMLAGRVVPVLGTDVRELAQRLAHRFGYQEDDGGRTLARVAQYVAVMKGSGPLYDELHELLAADVPPTDVHRFFASLPPVLRAGGAPHQLLVTTSYDHALERAFDEAGEEVDVVSYVASGRGRGQFCHIAPNGTGTLIDRPNTYVSELDLQRRTVILKLHGRADPSESREWESFVVTEDDYIDYLAQAEIANVVPVSLAARLRRSHFLFLGYTMADWNLRVVLNRLWGDQPLTYRSWAVQPAAKPLEREFWRRRDVDVLEAPLEAYAAGLGRYLEARAGELTA